MATPVSSRYEFLTPTPVAKQETPYESVCSKFPFSSVRKNAASSGGFGECTPVSKNRAPSAPDKDDPSHQDVKCYLDFFEQFNQFTKFPGDEKRKYRADLEYWVEKFIPQNADESLLQARVKAALVTFTVE